jgi:phage protein D/phage baseplate assembly protein gpV
MFNFANALNQIMPEQLLNSDVVTYAIKVNGSTVPEDVLVTAIKVVRTVNRIPYAMVTILDGEVADQTFRLSDTNLFTPGNSIEIQAGYGAKNKTIFKGIIIKHGIKATQSATPVLTIECKDVAVKMTVGRKNTYFVDQKDSDIIEEIARRYGIQTDVDTTDTEHGEMVQYYASDWDFVVTRAEANSLLVVLQDGKLSAKKPDFDQEPSFTLMYGSSIYEFEAEMDARDQYPSVKASTWNPANQEVTVSEASASGVSSFGGGFGSVLSSAASAVSSVASTVGIDLPVGEPPNTDFTEVMGLRNFAVQHTGFLSEQETQDWAKAQWQKSQLAKLRGRVKFKGIADAAVGKVIKLNNVGLRHNGNVLVTALSHEISDGMWMTHAQFGLSADWFAHDMDDVTDVSAASLLPAVRGLQIGIVTRLEGDPDGEDRVKVRLPLVSNSGEGVWMRIACQDAGNQRGSFFRPEIGDEVVVGFLNDDPREGIIVGMLNSSSKPAPLSSSDQNHQKGWITRSNMKMIFDDDKKSLTIETPIGKKITIDEDAGKIQIEDNHNNKIVMNSDGISIESGAKLVLKAVQDVQVEGLNVNQKANANFKIEGQSQTQVSSTADLVIQGAFVRIN